MSEPAPSIRLTDPAVILAGIRQFGLAPDGSDLRDLSTAIETLQKEVSTHRLSAEKWKETAMQAEERAGQLQQSLETMAADVLDRNQRVAAAEAAREQAERERDAAKREVEICHARETCMCGDYMKDHGTYSGHSPVSMYDYALDRTEQERDAARAQVAALCKTLRGVRVLIEPALDDDPESSHHSAVDLIDQALASPPGETPAGLLEMPIEDVNDLDDVVRELGIESSDTTPAEAVRELKAEIERLRSTQGGQPLHPVINRIIRDVAELPDRTSPDQPHMMLVTGGELNDILWRHLDPTPPGEAPAEAVEQWADKLTTDLVAAGEAEYGGHVEHFPDGPPETQAEARGAGRDACTLRPTNAELWASIRNRDEHINILVKALRPFAHYWCLNDLHERPDDDAIEVPVADLRLAHEALAAPAPTATPPGGEDSPLRKLENICAEIYERWDKDQRSGKLLAALSGTMPGYRQDVEDVRTALASCPAAVRDSALEEAAQVAEGYLHYEPASEIYVAIASAIRALRTPAPRDGESRGE